VPLSQAACPGTSAGGGSGDILSRFIAQQIAGSLVHIRAFIDECCL